MWILERPSALLLLLLVPFAVYVQHFWRNRGGKLIFPFHVWHGGGFAPRHLGLSIGYGLAVVAFWGGVCFSIIALAGPSTVTRERIYLNRGIDIMVVLDESPSMATRDMSPGDRFDAARSMIRQFISTRQNDPIGLVGFGSQALLRVPPTLDYASLDRSLASMHVMDLGDGTAIGLGLSVAILHLENSSATHKLIILLTDGQNNDGEILPVTAAQIARQKGIRIFAVGLGRNEPAPLEFTDPQTGKTYRGTYEGGFDAEALRQIADISGGAYFYAGSEGTLESVFRSIDALATVERRIRIQVRTDERYQLFILLALGMFTVDFLIRKWMLREVM
ncbi:MAG TPA: VWA domain-containing protein [Spirochaetia bacterium]|nr:VWA domain-containing protein [Spirochaetia bacterium]